MWPWTARSKDIAKAEENTIAGLEAAKGYIRFELKERMGVRHVPELSFLADRSGRFQARIEELMDRSRKRQKAQANMASRSKGRRESLKAPDRITAHGVRIPNQSGFERIATSASTAAPKCRSPGRPANSPIDGDPPGSAQGRAVSGLFALAAGRRCGGQHAGDGHAARQMGKRADLVTADGVPAIYRAVAGS